MGAPSRPSAAVVTDHVLEQDMSRRMGFLAMLALLFIRASTVHEILFSLTGTPLFLLYIFTPPAIAGVIMSGGIARTMRHRAAVFFMAFCAWILVAIPFSSWFGGSVMTAFYYFRDHVPMLFFIAGTVLTWKECRTALNCLAVSAVLLIPFAIVYGGGERRLAFIGTIGNANDLAAHVLLLIPFLLIVFFRASSPKIFRLGALAFSVLGILVVFRTGSRGALLAIAAGILVFLFRANNRQRIVAALMVPLALIATLALVPQETLQRLGSIFGGEDAVEEAVQSSESREYVLRKSIEYSIRRPLTGVGPGQFSNYEGREATDAGGRSLWRVTHNAYTQVSSECGIPALLFLLAALGSMFRILGGIARRAHQAGNAEIAMSANLMITGLTMFCVAAIFLSLAFMFYFPTFIGLAIAMHFAVERELKIAPAIRPVRPQPRPPGIRKPKLQP
jgi:O-antigen ligase